MSLTWCCSPSFITSFSLIPARCALPFIASFSLIPARCACHRVTLKIRRRNYKDKGRGTNTTPCSRKAKLHYRTYPFFKLTYPFFKLKRKHQTQTCRMRTNRTFHMHNKDIAIKTSAPINTFTYVERRNNGRIYVCMRSQKSPLPISSTKYTGQSKKTIIYVF